MKTTLVLAALIACTYAGTGITPKGDGAHTVKLFFEIIIAVVYFINYVSINRVRVH